ncbi:hypothetical protein [Kiloniella sp.]|uniref:hypothetical protein n=1 Tax=Kiloniella sp. TaxID=1938587 RepID=UPI003A8F149D
MFYSSIGLAISVDGGQTFQKYSKAPIIQRNDVDPWCVLLPSVLFEKGLWRMWYVSGLGWDQQSNYTQSLYHICYAESGDGINWRREGDVCIGLSEGETNTAHPCVIRDGGIYKMWYSYEAGRGYRIGYAESSNGLEWGRMDHLAGITISNAPYENEMVCQPHVFSHKGKRYMFYNGNQFGRDGIALGVEE